MIPSNDTLTGVIEPHRVEDIELQVRENFAWIHMVHMNPSWLPLAQFW